MLEGTAQVDGKTVPVTNGRLRGKQITFDVQVENQLGTLPRRGRRRHHQGRRRLAAPSVPEPSVPDTQRS